MSTTYEQERTIEQKQVDAAVLKRVKRGIALLEERHGPDWVDKIDLESLDLTSGYKCVLGQVYGRYSDGLSALWPNLGDDVRDRCAQAHGFFAKNNASPTRWSDLDDAWWGVLTPVVQKAGK